MLNVLTVDVEEYFHPTELQASVDQSQWSRLPSRIDLQISRVLELLDARNAKATFFILGWVAEHHPRTIRKIVECGHEIACHSYAHHLVYSLTPEEFRRDTRRAVACIEDASGITPRAYRAPSYSITQKSLWALQILVEEGFTHDSSIYPIAHDRYGIPGSPRFSHLIQTPAGPIRELPIATVMLQDRVVPIGGGGYLRLLPYRYASAGIRRLNRAENQPACIYFHPWEIDPDQPRLASAFIARVRTYTGIKGMFGKLDRLLTEFQFSTLSGVYGDIDGSPVVSADQHFIQTSSS